ncbi:MAG TPA: hypothetical protein VJX29_03815 [Candidatus Acidoferrales bacterium]|nr:hypothetical protein [Candidatus Acidoferrales bacterium]
MAEINGARREIGRPALCISTQLEMIDAAMPNAPPTSAPHIEDPKRFVSMVFFSALLPKLRV